MIKFFLGVAVGFVILTGVLSFTSKPIGATSSGNFIGIYNATPITLRDGYGSALAVDSYGRLITR